MQHPKEVFDNPLEHWDFITANSDDTFEGQHFDRKQVGRETNANATKGQIDDLRNHIKSCMSAFGNVNGDGGLLVVGVSQAGQVLGIENLNEAQQNQLTDIDSLLRNHAARCKAYDCKNADGEARSILLTYSAYVEKAICETVDRTPVAWARQGKQNVVLTQEAREQIRRDKQIVDFELTPCCKFDPGDLDKDVLRQFKKTHLANARDPNWTDEKLLYEIGAIVHGKDEAEWLFTNAGLLFFGVNPQRVFSRAYIRLMEFDASHSDVRSRGLPTKERGFSGAIPQQIRQVRTFFRESSLFKTYQVRKADGGFRDDPELPAVAIDEAVVNAVAHRDYGTSLPIECCHYRDAFTVENPGRILQRGRDVPREFSLEDEYLDSMPRNSKIIEWLRSLRDQDGAVFVRALSEGTKAMKAEMLKQQLPAPLFSITNGGITVLTLVSNAPEREARNRAAAFVESWQQHTNMFRLQFSPPEALPTTGSAFRHKDVLFLLRDSLEARGWFVDSLKFGVLVAHRRSIQHPVPANVAEYVRLYPAYENHRDGQDRAACGDATGVGDPWGALHDQ